MHHPKTLTPPAFVKPLSLAFPIDDEAVTVTALGVADIAQALALCAPVLDELLCLSDQALARLEAGSPNMEDLHDMLDVLNKHGKAGIDLVAIGSDKPREWVEGLLPDRFAYLFSVVVMVNADFFSRARPVFNAAGELMAKARPPQESTGRPSLTL